MKGYIYFIINNLTQERYVGKTIELEKRKSRHYGALRKNKHINNKLQSAWNKYGEDNFSFDFKEFELENEKQLNDLERQYIKEYDSYYNGYNLTLGGDGGNTRGKLSFEDYCFIYIGCQWCRMTEKIAKFLSIDSSTVSAILREKAYLWFKEDADNLSEEDKNRIIEHFREVFGIDKNKPYDVPRVSESLSEDDYFYCLCVASSYGRGIEASLGRFFGKHKSFLSNGIKNKTKGKAYMALQRYRNLTEQEILQIGKEKFEEWNIQHYSISELKPEFNKKWRQ